MRIILTAALSILLIQGCASDDTPVNTCEPVPVSEQDEIIDQYIDQNGLSMQTTSSGIRYVIETPGTGDQIEYGSTVEVEYQGTLLNGSDFDSGTIGPITMTENIFIPGFEEGLLLFNEGSEGLIIIPGALGYGCFPPQNSVISDNEVLVFAVTILSVN